MATPALTAVHTASPASEHVLSNSLRRRIWLIAGALLILIIVADLIVVAIEWPFSKQQLTNVLQEATLRSVTVAKYRQTFLPPGCVAEDISFERHEHKDKTPIIHIEHLTIHASWWALMTAQYRLSLVKVAGMHVLVPPAEVHGKPDPLMPLNHTPSQVKKVTIDKIVADGAVLDWAHEDGSRPYRIIVDKFAALDVTNNSPIKYKAVVTNSIPSGKIESSGIFGPWRPNTPSETPLHGTYVYRDANLAALKEISGTMQASGNFEGKLGEIVTSGKVDVPQFHIEDTGNTREVKAQYKARVNGTNGNVLLDDVEADFNRTHLSANGRVVGTKAGKAATLQMNCQRGRAEDVLGLFVEAKEAPLTGSVQMNARVDLPPGKLTPVRRMHMWGEFAVEGGKFTDQDTQGDLNRLSASARPGASPDATAFCRMKAQADVRNGVATLTNMDFSVPGASAKMEGTYGLVSPYDIALHGVLYTDGKPWTAVTGFKSFMVRIITPFLKKQKNVREVPFKIGGDYHDINVGLNLGGKK